jgi:glycosyltransferase involved in cell wall biosynthesis
MVVLTESLASELRAYGHENVFVIPNIVPAAALPSEYVHEKPKIGLLMGRANPQKGFDIFLEALALQEIPGWRFVIVGPGIDKDQSLQEIVRKHGLQNVVSLLPASTNPYEHIRKASCVIMPSRYEGLPLVALESLAIGRPVIAADTDGLRDLVTDGVNGRIFPNGDVEKLSACLVSTCQDEEKLSEYARNAPLSLARSRAHSVVDAWKKLALQFGSEHICQTPLTAASDAK